MMLRNEQVTNERLPQESLIALPIFLEDGCAEGMAINGMMNRVQTKSNTASVYS